MFRRFSANFAVISIILDTALAAGALWAAAALRYPMNRLSFLQQVAGPVDLPWALFIVFPMTWVLVMLLFSVYDGRRNFRVVDEYASLTGGSALAGVAMAGVLFFSYRDLSRFLFIFFLFLGYILFISWRSAYRLAYRYRLVKGAQSRKVLILGAGKNGTRLAEQIVNSPQSGLNLAGFLDDDSHKASVHARILGGMDAAREVILEKKIDDVVLALPRSEDAQLNKVVSELHDLPVRVWIIPDYFSLTLHNAAAAEFAGIPMLDLRAPALSEYQRMIKRGFDLAVILAGAPIVLPLMAAAAILIIFDSRGPVFYLAERAGENSRRFKMIKFRTMVVGADLQKHPVELQDEHGRAILKVRYDPRVTRIGRFLRRTSLDELPQVINVLKGEMSLVGPRPEQPQLVEKYALWQRKRFAVPQGITGWWQINGRSDKPMHLHTEEDLYYVQHYSLWLDVQILARTFWTVIQGKGAY